jgi:hypothetical protein
MFTHILLPTDGSNLSQAAIQKGVQLAKNRRPKYRESAQCLSRNIICIRPVEFEKLHNSVIN